MIISNSAYADFYEYTIKMIMEQNKFKSYTIIVTVHYKTMNYDNSISNEEMKNYTKMKEDLQSSINFKNPLQVICSRYFRYKLLLKLMKIYIIRTICYFIEYFHRSDLCSYFYKSSN